jgi:non-heme chloroperoxidase
LSRGLDRLSLRIPLPRWVPYRTCFDEVEGADAPSPTKGDRSGIAAFQKYFAGYYGGILPEDEIRQLYQITATGAVGERLGHPIANKVDEVEKERFTTVDTRALVIIPFPNVLNIGVTHDPVKLRAYKAQEASRKQGQLEVWRKQRNAEVVVIPNVTHQSSCPMSPRSSR